MFFAIGMPCTNYDASVGAMLCAMIPLTFYVICMLSKCRLMWCDVKKVRLVVLMCIAEFNLGLQKQVAKRPFLMHPINLMSEHE